MDIWKRPAWRMALGRAGQWRLISLLGAMAASLAAVYIFYLQPWLQLSSPLDPWLAEQRCWVDSALHGPTSPGPSAGLPPGNWCVGRLCWRVWGLPRRWGNDGTSVGLLLGTPSYAGSRRRPLLVVLGVLGAIMVMQQAVMGWQGQQAMRHLYWLLGLLTWAALAILWDSAARPTLDATIRKLAIAGAVGLILLALGGSLMGNPRSLLLLALGGVGMGIGLRWLRRQPASTGDLRASDYILMLALGLAALLLGLNHLAPGNMRSWVMSGGSMRWHAIC